MTLHLHRSNRLERLVDVLAGLHEPDTDPFATETIIIQTRGLERWLGMELAKHRGVFANARFLTLEDYLADLCDQLSITPSATSSGASTASTTAFSPDPWRPGRLAWPIAEILREADLDATDVDLHALGTWLQNNRAPSTDAMTFPVVELAQRIAEVFHRYTIYRPDMLAAWESDAPPTDLPLTAVWQRAL